MARLADIAMVLSGVSPKSGGIGPARFVQIKDLDPGRRNLATGAAPTANRAIPIEMGDVLVVARGEGDLAVRPDVELLGAFAALDLYLVRPDPAQIDPDYLATFLNSEVITGVIRASATGGSLPRVPKNTLTELLVPTPPLERQAAIAQFAACADRLQTLMRKKLAAEKHLFQTCLKQVFAEL